VAGNVYVTNQVAVSPNGKYAYVANSRDNTVSVITPLTNGV
jgi:DNA-binding beta-propeller fold protein YncE